MSATPPLRRGVVLHAVSSYLPERVMTNDELATMVDTSDQWIRERTGIASRRISSPLETASYMGTRAASSLLERAGTPPIDLLVVATCTADSLVPSVACLIQKNLGLSGFPAYDVNAACSGFAYGAATVEAHLASGLASRALLVATEQMSSITDFSDRSTCVLFGDGAGAMLFESAETGGNFRTACLGANGGDSDLIVVDQRRPGEKPSVRMNGKETYRKAVDKMCTVIRDTSAKVGWNVDEVAHFIPHQANQRIMEAVAQRLHVPGDRMVSVIDHMGNTSSASIPLAIDECAGQGRFADGDKIICVSFGAGATWGGVAIEWSSSCSHS